MWLHHDFLNYLLYSIVSLIPIVSYYILNAMIFKYKAVCLFFFPLGYTQICVHLSSFLWLLPPIRKTLRIGNSEAVCLSMTKSLSRRTHPFTSPPTMYERVCLYTLNCGTLDVALSLAGTHEKSELFHFLLPVKQD